MFQVLKLDTSNSQNQQVSKTKTSNMLRPCGESSDFADHDAILQGWAGQVRALAIFATNSNFNLFSSQTGKEIRNRKGYMCEFVKNLFYKNMQTTSSKWKNLMLQ